MILRAGELQTWLPVTVQTILRQDALRHRPVIATFSQPALLGRRHRPVESMLIVDSARTHVGARDRIGIGHRMDEGVGEGVDDVAGDQADLAVLVAGDVAGESVDEDAELGGLEGGELLAEQRGDHAGQDVAGAAGGHAGVPGRVDVIPAAVGHDGAGPLEDDDERLRERRQCARPAAIAVGLDLGDVRTRSAGRTRRDGESGSPGDSSPDKQVGLADQGVQAVGVDDQRLIRCRDQEPHELPDVVRLAQPRPDGDDVGRSRSGVRGPAAPRSSWISPSSSQGRG